MPRVVDVLRLEEAAMMRWFNSCSAGFDQDNPTDANGQGHPTQIAPSKVYESAGALTAAL
jgi:hypothetical protein